MALPPQEGHPSRSLGFRPPGLARAPPYVEQTPTFRVGYFGTAELDLGAFLVS